MWACRRGKERRCVRTGLELHRHCFLHMHVLSGSRTLPGELGGGEVCAPLTPGTPEAGADHCCCQESQDWVPAAIPTRPGADTGQVSAHRQHILRKERLASKPNTAHIPKRH